MLVGVIGNFGDSHVLTDGQRIKTVELYQALIEKYGEDQVSRVNLYHKNPILLSARIVGSFMNCRNLIVLVSKNGRKTLMPLLVSLNRLFHRRIFHSLIASTTHETLEQYPWLIRYYNQLSGNWSETYAEKKLLEDYGLKNVSVIKNFKNLTILDEKSLIYQIKEPFRFCTFSRIEELKGIADAVKAIHVINHRFGRTVCTLDLYGQVMDAYDDDFCKLQKQFGDAVRYCGVVDFDKSVETLKHYYMLLFPTKYYTEGIPGTIIDALSAGVPVISSEWESCYDIMTETVGITYKFNDFSALTKAIQFAISNPTYINAMKHECLKEAKQYSSEQGVEQISAYLE